MIDNIPMANRPEIEGSPQIEKLMINDPESCPEKGEPSPVIGPYDFSESFVFHHEAFERYDHL